MRAEHVVEDGDGIEDGTGLCSAYALRALTKLHELPKQEVAAQSSFAR